MPNYYFTEKKNEDSHPQDEQATEMQHIRSRAKRKAAEDTCVRPLKIVRSEIQTVGEEVLQPHDLKKLSHLGLWKGHRYTGYPLKRVIFHFTQMSTFLPLKRPFISAHLSSQSAQRPFAFFKTCKHHLSC